MLEHRERLIDEQQRKIAALREKRQLAQQQFVELEKSAAENVEATAHYRRSGDMPTAQLYSNYYPILMQKIHQKKIEIASIEADLKRENEKLKKQFMEKKSLELLKERDHIAWLQKEKLDEEKMLNEINAIRYNTQMRENMRKD
ncbi:flagellar export protein FliJ [Chrysiogenes arsenatis]|uniref:flagellar export protein FliJ n=1 Tax=Chrysiogenes arsenatis TaxID=309797 RepID=UPI001F33F185|nr:flagellar FliJ family protein [Chrysiogenes arsenatis]